MILSRRAMRAELHFGKGRFMAVLRRHKRLFRHADHCLDLGLWSSFIYYRFA